MRLRLFDGLLILVILIGGVLAVQTGLERSRLTERHGRLARLAGELPIADPSKVYIRALDTGEPLHFAWRVYFPPNYRQSLRSRFASLGSSTSTKPSEFIVRVRFREDDQGTLDNYTHFANGSSRSTFGDKSLADLLRNRWDRVRVEQLGMPEVAVLETDQPGVLLRLALPDDMQDEARKTLSPGIHQQFLPVLFELEIGPEAGKP